MEVFLFEPAVYEINYNCSFYDIDRVPLDRRRHKAVGIAYILLFFFFQIPYIPILYIFRKTKFFSQSCYKLMFYIGIIDVAGLTMSALVTGVFTYTGVVFCTSPSINYILGVIAILSWVAASDTSVVLALNRCVAMYDVQLCKCLFGGRRLYFWLMLVFVHVFCIGFISTPILFSGIYASWFVNPHIGYFPDPDSKYLSPLHFWHNLFIASSYSSLYICFLLLLIVKRYRLSAAFLHTQRNDTQKGVFLQVIIICATNFISALIYIYMQFTDVSETLILVAEFSWILTHGLPSIIYLILNRSVRMYAWQTFHFRQSSIWPSLTTSGD